MGRDRPCVCTSICKHAQETEGQRFTADLLTVPSPLPFSIIFAKHKHVAVYMELNGHYTSGR